METTPDARDNAGIDAMAATERLFAQTFLVRLKTSTTSSEERKSAVNIDVRLESASSRRELKIQLTDDDDLFFLFSLTLGKCSVMAKREFLVSFAFIRSFILFSLFYSIPCHSPSVPFQAKRISRF